MGQIYCTIAELIDDLSLNGDEKRLMERIESASQFIERHLGIFIPMTKTRILLGVSTETLMLKMPLLSATSVKVDDEAVTDYTLEPRDREWENGPYTWLTRDDYWGDEVEVAGLWGLYLETKALGINATQLIGATTLVTTDGSLVSPGMVLGIGDEQELVTAGNGGLKSPAATAATSQLTDDVDASTEEIPVDDGTEFHEGETLQISTEDLYVRKIAVNTLVCVRGWNGTTKAAHLENTAISVYRTYTVTRGVNGTTAAAHATAAVSRYLVPADVNWLCRQIAALMRAKAMTGFSGRSGNSESGESFFVNEFPRQIADIKRNYDIPYL